MTTKTSEYAKLYTNLIEPLNIFLGYRSGLVTKQDLVKNLVTRFNDDELHAMLLLLSDIRVERAQNPLSKFRPDRPEQMEFIESLHRITIALCGNRWGKTIAMMYHLVSTATGRNPKAKHQPDPSRPLRVWVIGESWPVLNDTILKEVLGLLKEGEYVTHKQNSYVSTMDITAPNGGVTHIRFIPSGDDAGDQKFESAALHYVYVDEGIRADLFRQIIFRIGDSDGQLFQAFTRLPENMHLADYLIDLEEGDGEFAPLLNKGYIKLIHGYTQENIYLTKDDYDFLATSVEGNDELKQARLFGRVEKPKGAVFSYKGTVKVHKEGVVSERNYNDFSWDEFARITHRELGRWDIIHDYGQAAPATWAIIWTSRTTGTSYFVDCIKRAGMSIQESSEKAYEMIKRWECYYDLNSSFADKQILDRGKKNNRTDVEVTTLQQYKDKHVIDEAGNLVACFPPKMRWVCKQSDKNNRRYTLDLLRELIEEENPLTPTLPYMRFSPLCKQIKREMRFLRFFDPKKHTENVRREITEGDDHFIDPMRYFIANKINHTMWRNRKKLRKSRNELKYEIGGSIVPWFHI